MKLNRFFKLDLDRNSKGFDSGFYGARQYHGESGFLGRSSALECHHHPLTAWLGGGGPFRHLGVG